jgi:hypothetical protein
MNIIIKESQLQKLIEQVKVDKVEVLADQIWDATSGIGTDEDKVYDALKQITNLQFFVKVNTKLISKYKESFYDIVNSTMEFTDSEKNEIVKILNSKGVAHIINDNGDIKYKKSPTQFTSQQGANFYSDPTILTPSENLISFSKSSLVIMTASFSSLIPLYLLIFTSGFTSTSIKTLKGLSFSNKTG